MSKPFNPLIANMFYKAGFVESWGKGTNNIVDDCLKMGLAEPKYKYTQQAIQVFLYKLKQKNKDVGINHLYEFIEKNQPIRVSVMQESFTSVSSRTLERWIKQLKDEGKIIYEGSKKTGGYRIK